MTEMRCAMCAEKATLCRVVDGFDVWVCREHEEACDRRTRRSRRRIERRNFPRPEGRRLSEGRRAGD